MKIAFLSFLALLFGTAMVMGIVGTLHFCGSQLWEKYSRWRFKREIRRRRAEPFIGE